MIKMTINNNSDGFDTQAASQLDTIHRCGISTRIVSYRFAFMNSAQVAVACEYENTHFIRLVGRPFAVPYNGNVKLERIDDCEIVSCRLEEDGVMTTLVSGCAKWCVCLCIR